MGIKEVINKQLGDKDSLVTQRYRASKLVFIVSTFLFFGNYLLVSKNEGDIIFGLVPYSYAFFIVSMMTLLFFFLKKRLAHKLPAIVFYIFIPVLIVIGILLASPFIFSDILTIKN